MTIKMQESYGGSVLPREVGNASTGGPWSQIKNFTPLSESRIKPRFRGQKRSWYNKRRRDLGKQPQHAPRPEEDSRQHQHQDHGQHQPQPQPLHQRRLPVKLFDRPDYFNFNPSNGLHTPGPLHPGACELGGWPVDYFAPPPPMLMAMPPSPPRFDHLDPSTLPLAVLAQEHHKHCFWDQLEVTIPMWSPPRPSIDPLKIWTEVRGRQAEYRPLYYQRSTLRPWAIEFVPGRLFHPILGW